MESKSKAIIEWAKERMEQTKSNLDPQVWVEVALKLTILLGEENALLYELQQAKARKQLELQVDDMSVAQSKLLLEATDEYRNYHQQKALIEQIAELIRVAKLQARINQGI